MGQVARMWSMNARSGGGTLASLLRRSPNILLIPGTSSVGHLRENLAAASLTLSEDEKAAIDGIGG